MRDNIFGTICKVLVVLWTVLCFVSCVIAPIGAPIGALAWILPTVVLTLAYFLFGRTPTDAAKAAEQRGSHELLAVLIVVILVIAYCRAQQGG